MNEPERELRELRTRVARLTDEARKNELAWKRSQQREMALLDAEDLPTLFERMTVGLRQSFRLQATTVTIVDPDHEIRTLLGHDAGPAVRFVDAIGDVVTSLRGRARPWLGPYRPAEHETLFGGATGLASVALLPLLRRARVVGSLHFGSARAERFTRDHATDFLMHLGLMAAFGLENAVNRARLVRAGFTDPLTGWHNRAYLQHRLDEELARCRREGSSLVCLMLDLDHFKPINDEHGHVVGDTVLREVARRIGAEVRSSDISARYGGEEFIVLMPDTELEAGAVLAERIRARVAAEPFGATLLTAPLSVTVSIGVAQYRPGGDRDDVATAGQRLVAAADAALYETKARGRNAVTLAER